MKGGPHRLVHGLGFGGDLGSHRVEFQLLAEGGACYDLSYGKAFEPFAAWACTQGATRVSDGLGMLVGQAAASFVLWRGIRPEVKPVIVRLRAPDGRDIPQEAGMTDGKARDKATHLTHGQD